jgi:hypothetical protein
VWSPGSAWPPSIKNSLAAQTAGAYASIGAWDKQKFFDSKYGSSAGIAHLRPQPWFWYFDCWAEMLGVGESGTTPCTKDGAGACARCDKKIGGIANLPKIEDYPPMGGRKIRYIRHAFEEHFAETPFDNERARWHWKIAFETMSNSWNDPAEDPVRAARLGVPAIFAAGMKDDDKYGGLYLPTRDLFLAARKKGLPCKGRWLAHSGHSLHNERPLTLRSILSEPVT